MHEMSLIQGVLEVADQELRKLEQTEQVSRITKINLKIGNLTHVLPQALEFCFEIMSKGTVAEGAVLNIECIPVRVRCKECDWEFSAENYDFSCSRCGSCRVKITEGRELLIDSLEVE